MLEYVEYLYYTKVLLSLLAIYLLFKLGKSHHNLHVKLGHRGPPPILFLGNYVDVVRYGIRALDRMSLQKYGRLYPFYYGNINLCVVADEEVLKQILLKEAKCFTDRLDIGFTNKLTEKMLTMLNGKEWERVRTLIAPTLSSGKLRKMTPLIADGVNLFEERIAKHPFDEPIDFKEFYGGLTMDVIARTMFGMHVDCQTNPNNLFIIHVKQLFKIPTFNPFLAIFYISPKFSKFLQKKLSRFGSSGSESLKFFHNNLRKAIEEREKSAEQYNDFLALVLKAQKQINDGDPDQSENMDSKFLTNREIMAQSLLFLLAGYETTSTTLTYATYFLAKNPTAQQEVYEEILDIIGNEGEITYESLLNMPILDAAISETLRLCPPVARLDRRCTQDVVLVTSDNKKLKVQKGDIFTIPVYAIHTDPSIWPDPDTFDLHRFDPGNKKNHSPFAFLPFGMGIRSCVGMRFALLEVKWALAIILQKFEIFPCAETMEKLELEKSGRMKGQILLKIIKRD